MRCLKILFIFLEFTVVFGIEPLVIVHGGAGSVAALRVIRNQALKRKITGSVFKY